MRKIVLFLMLIPMIGMAQAVHIYQGNVITTRYVSEKDLDVLPVYSGGKSLKVGNNYYRTNTIDSLLITNDSLYQENVTIHYNGRSAQVHIYGKTADHISVKDDDRGNVVFQQYNIPQDDAVAYSVYGLGKGSIKVQGTGNTVVTLWGVSLETDSASIVGVETDSLYLIIRNAKLQCKATDSEAIIRSLANTRIAGQGRTTILNMGGEGISSYGTIYLETSILESTTTGRGIHAKGDLFIDTDSLYVKSSGRDAIRSDGKLWMNKGYTVADAAPEGNSFKGAKGFHVMGGTLVGWGGNVSVPKTPNDTTETQPVVVFVSSMKENTPWTVTSAGKYVMGAVAPRNLPKKSKQVFSCPELLVKKKVTMVQNKELSGVPWHGLYAPVEASGTGKVMGQENSLKMPYSLITNENDETSEEDHTGGSSTGGGVDVPIDDDPTDSGNAQSKEI